MTDMTKWTEDEIRRAVDEIQQDQDEWEAAVARGIGDVPLSKLERAAVKMFVATVIMDEPGEHPAEDAARRVVSEPLIAKLALGLFLEYATNDQAIEDGILGRAVDQAIDQLMPYAKASPNLGPAGRDLFEDDI